MIFDVFRTERIAKIVFYVIFFDPRHNGKRARSYRVTCYVMEKGLLKL